jgi:hypothetical protein
MAIQLRLSARWIFPFIIFRSLGQLAMWLAMIAAFTAIASTVLNSGELKAALFGGAIGSLIPWLGLLPYELRIDMPSTGECLSRIHIYLARSRYVPADNAEGVSSKGGAWIPNVPWWRRYRGQEVAVSVDGRSVLVRGPASMIKPLYRNFNGVWRGVHDPA